MPDNRPEPVCPHCRIVWELPDMRPGEPLETRCGHCGGSVILTAHGVLTYTTTPADAPEGERT